MNESTSSHILLIGPEPSDETDLINCFKHLDHFRIHHALSDSDAASLLYEENMNIIIINVTGYFNKSFETAMMLRNREIGKRIPIIFLTRDNPGREIPFTVIMTGPVDIVIKPVNPFILKNKCELFRQFNQLEKKQNKHQPFADAYKWIFNNLPFSMIVTDKEGVIIEINPHFLKQFAQPGYHRKDYIWKNVFTEQSLILPELVNACRSIISGLTFNDKDIHRTRSADNKDLYFTISGSPLMKNGELSGALLIHHDISERIRTEHELTVSKKELERANNELQRLTENLETAIEKANKMAVEAEIATITKSGFLASMSHEIRTPLNAVIGFTDLVLDSSLTDEQREYIESIKSSSVTFLELINDILDFSKIEAQMVTLESIPFNLEKIIEDVFTTISMRAYEKNIDLSYRIDPELPEFLKGDPVRIKQILINLIGNSIKFTSSGQIILKVVQVENDNREDIQLRFSVSDTGIGIQENQKNKLFKPFSQVSESTTREYGGTGLGLAITKQLVQLMNGGIWIVSPNPDSQNSPGTIFYFTAVFKIAQKPETHIPFKIHESISGKRILVVEENKALLDIYCSLLIDTGLTPEALDNPVQIHKKMAINHSDPEPVKFILIGSNPVETNLLYFESLLNDHPDIKLIITLHPSHTPDFETLKRCKDRLFYIKKPIRKTGLIKLYTGLTGLTVENADQLNETDHSSNSLSPLKVLLVEDNKINQKVATKMLIKMGHTVRVADNGKEAVDIFQTEDPFHVILMDGQMPVMDGFQATEVIRRREKADPSRERVPIIALTANAMKGDRDRFIEAGMDDYISKPVKYTDLMEIISKVMSKKMAGDLTAEETTIYPDTPEF